MRHLDKTVPCLRRVGCHHEWPRLQLANKMKQLLVILALLAPLTAIAGDDICTKLIPDITRNYDVSKLEWMRNGNPHVSQDLVSCNYRAEAPSMSGNLPVTVIVLLNATNNRFTVEIR